MMENIETLLAAVAAFNDDEATLSNGLDVGSRNSESSPGIQQVSAPSKLNSDDNQLTSSMAAPPPAQAVVPSAAVPGAGALAKKRRGRPPKGQMAVNSPPPKRAKVEDEGEDVCFICFDGGSLVLCDRKGCPKAYHPACIKRDEEFFKSKARWNCGWHICSVCRKASHYICYTCPYSLCKGCTKDTDYLCVRGNKGFCTTCMKTIMLIEKKEQANVESIQVDFDDKTSWEYLFKTYWVCLKEKLSLSLNELEHAKKPCDPVVSLPSRWQLSRVHRTAIDVRSSVSYGSGEHLELNKPPVQSIHNDEELSIKPSSTVNCVEKQRLRGEYGPGHNSECGSSIQLELCKPHLDSDLRQIDESRTVMSSSSSHVEKVTDTKLNREKESAELMKNKGGEWASKELLEFVGHVKDGDLSPMSQFDTQTMVLEYVKRNRLRDPHQKSQIICDAKLRNLFGKPRVGHFEMLKLLEYHILIKDDSLKNGVVPAGVVGLGVHNEVIENAQDSSFSVNSRKRKPLRKSGDRISQADSNEYAAIDIHNINLIYLRRSLVEDLSKNQNDFDSKVIDSVVRIRVATSDQKQDVYRLVQVVGTSEASEPYKIGDRTVNVMLEVLNLDKKELVSIDAISNQDFTEDECKRLRQSIRCGLVKRLTVGAVQKKAMALQEIKVNDGMDSEIQRLNHLRDRASENGRKKELREYVEKLQLLNSPKERQHRISQVPDVHSDRTMDPDYKPEEDKIGLTSKIDEHGLSSDPYQNGRRRVSPRVKGKDLPKQVANRTKSEKTLASGSNKLDNHLTRSAVSNPGDQISTCQLMQDSGQGTNTATNSGSPDHIETERLWHYRDPNGKIQGPFSMMYLRKWSMSGFFPSDMRIWTNHEQYDSLRLSDALNGKFHAASDLRGKPLKAEENVLAGGCRASEVNNQNGGYSVKALTSCSNDDVLPEKSSGVVAAETSWPQFWGFLKDNSSSDAQQRNMVPSCSTELTHNARTDRGTVCGEVEHVSPVEEGNAPNGVVNNLEGHGLAKVSSVEDRRGQTAEASVRPLDIDLGSCGVDPVSVPEPISKTPSSSKNLGNSFVFDLPSPTPSTAAENQQSVSSVSAQKTCFLELLSPAPRSSPDDQGAEAIDSKPSGTSNVPAETSWSMASNLVLGGVQMPAVSEEWCGYSPTPAKPSSHEWEDTSIVYASSSKPPETSGESTANPNSGGVQIPPAQSLPNWLTHEMIEFDALGEESVSDLLAEVDAMESQGGLVSSPLSALKFAREYFDDCKDDCFSSMDEFSSVHGPLGSDVLSSTGEMQQMHQVSPSTHIDGFDFFAKSNTQSYSSCGSETKAPVYTQSDFHPQGSNSTVHEMVGETTAPSMGPPDTVDPGWGTVQGNINLVTVQGNVNLVLGGPVQGMPNLNWGMNHGTSWMKPPAAAAPHNRSSPMVGRDNQRKFSGERFTSTRAANEPGFGRGLPLWSRQPYGSGGYSRPLPKGQRVCKFYESGHCKKGALCDYLHP